MKFTYIIFIVSIGFFMEWLDATALNTALPQIAYSFSINPIYLKVALTSYLLSVGIFIPVSGWFADRYGVKLVYTWAIIIFIIGSMGCGLSVNISMLVAFRVIQGIGGAFLTPLGRIILLRVYGSDRFAEVITLVTLVSGVGMVLGPLLGGGFTSWISWRWIFFINIPVGLLTWLAINRFMPNFPKAVKLAQLDLIGFVYIGMGLAVLLFFFDMLVEPYLTIGIKVLLALISLVFFIAYKLHSKTLQFPLISRKLFQNKKFLLLNSASCAMRLAISTPPFLIPLLLQTGYHFSAFQAGVYMVSTALGLIVCKPLVKPLLRHYDAVTLVYITVCLNILVLLSFSYVSGHWSAPLLIITLFAYGAGYSIPTTVMNVSIYQSVNKNLYSQAVPFNSAFIQLTASFAISIAALMIILQLKTADLYHVIPISVFKDVFQYECVFLVLAGYLFRRAVRHG